MPRIYTVEELTNPSGELLKVVHSSVEEMKNFDDQLQQHLSGSN